MSAVTLLLKAAAGGDRKAAADLLPLVYDELRGLAAARLATENPGHTLNPTALVHEAYLRLVGEADTARWKGRAHFLAAGAEAIRRILIDHARRKRAVKRGGRGIRVETPVEDVAAPDFDDRLLALDDALNRLAAIDPVAARVVECREFAGMGHEAIASSLGITVYRARQKWAFARAWLRDFLGET